MQDCCVESSERTNILLKKAYNQAQEIDGSKTKLWPSSKQKSTPLITSGSETRKPKNWFKWFSINKESSLKPSKEPETVYTPSTRGKIYTLYYGLGNLVCSEEMT